MTRSVPGRRLVWGALFCGSTLSLLVSIGIARTWIVVGSVQGRWAYEYIEGIHRRPMEAFVAAFALCAALLIAVPLDSVRRRQWPVVLLWVAVSFAVQGLLRSGTPYRLAEMFASDGSSSFYTPTLQYSAGTMIRDFNRIRPTLPTHARSNMPGKLMLVYALESISARPAVLAWVAIALSNIGGILFYLFVRDLLADRVSGLIALIFYLVTPAKLFFFPILNTVTPAILLLFAWPWLRAMQGRRIVHAVLAGVALYGLVLFEPLPLVTGIVCAAFVARWLWTGDLTLRVVAVQSLVVLAAFAAAHALMLAMFHFDLIQTVRETAADAMAFNVESRRPYGIWVRQNLVDFFFATGICQAVVFIVAVAWSVWHAKEQPAMLFLGTALAVIAADLIGINRGEVVRLWIFLACFVQIAAAFFCAIATSRTAVLLVLATTLLQSALGTSMLNFGSP